MIRIITFGFLAGFVSVLVFHQGTAFLMYAFGNDVPAVVSFFGRTNAPFAMTPTRPLGVPLVGSQAFWGGVWGIVLALILVKLRPPALLSGFVFGALALTAVAVTLVPALKGLPGWSGAIPWRGLLYNGAWGWGVALMLLAPLGLRR
ncbi:hypothetical protein ACFQY5_20740 [Paeniroseomonas aquatica]|uniref:DUF1761 domain-containing protein n=1 Tax=Paeniroseomonas aquatica TaxID=373043 RepID=A0ABT8A4T7_9PROT|nr:hypothetical protein [Paeniroseomonas aquatica]MDN3564693.1 hypothetical protein [Paeniroseomonas aquatica]